MNTFITPIEKIIPDIDIYYNSIESVFNKTLELKDPRGFAKLSRSELIISGLLMSYVMLFIISLIPVTPLLILKILHEYVEVNTFNSLPIYFNNFFILWIEMFILTLPAFKLLFHHINKTESKVTSSTLDVSLFPFCFLYKSIVEIENYLINSRKEHLDNAKEMFKYYLKISDIEVGVKAFPGYRQVDRIDYRIHELVDFVTKKYTWIKLMPESLEIIKGLEEISKISERINMGIEINQTIIPLKVLLVIEFSKIRQIREELLKSYAVDNSEFQKLCLLDYAKQINKMTPVYKEVTKPIEEKNKLFKKLSLFIDNSLGSDNILICFFSWLILIEMVCILITLLYTKLTGK